MADILDQIFPRLVRTLQTYFRIGNVALVDNGSSVLKVMNGDQTADIKTQASNFNASATGPGYIRQTSAGADYSAELLTEHPNTISASYTITADYQVILGGDIDIAAGVNIKINSGSRLIIV